MSETDLKYAEECNDEYKLDNSEDRVGEFISVMVLRGFYRPYNFEEIFSDKDYVEDITKESEYEDTITALCRASTVGAKSMLTSDIYNETAKKNKGKNAKYYIMEYHFGISTAVGIILLLLLVNFCLDAGARMVKLSFLQLIAPIPIVSYIDPASGKNGMFMKWLKEVGKTWISLFIKLLAIFFAISIIQHVDTLVPVGADAGNAGIWVQIFVIIGALMFAKQLPDLIQNITGIKMEGGFNLNPFKKIENEALGGKFIANTSRGAIMAGANAAVSGIGQLASNGYNFFKTQSNLKKAIDKEEDENKKAKLQRQLKQMHAGRFAVTSLGGAFRGTTRGLRSGFTSGRKGDYHVFKNAKEDISAGNKNRDNLANIHKYNSEINYRAKQDKQKFKNEYEAIKARTDLTEEEKDKLLKDKKQEYQKQKADYKEQHYGFFERKVGERLDQWAGVKNEYGGVGYYDKKISDLDKDISNYDTQEVGMRNALSNYCANNSLNQSMLQDYHKKYAAKRSEINEEFNNKKAAEGQQRYNNKFNNEASERTNIKFAAEGQQRCNEKMAAEGQQRYVEKETAEFNSRMTQQVNEEYNDRYAQKRTEEYNRVLEENNGAPLTNEQLEEIHNNVDLAVRKDIEREVKQKLKDEVDAEIKQAVMDELEQKVKAEIEQEVEAEILKEAEEKYLVDAYKEMEEQYGINEDEVRRQHKLVQTQLDSIDKIDDKAKQARKEKKEFTELLSARESAEKK